jgi:hypothetical protein
MMISVCGQRWRMAAMRRCNSSSIPSLAPLSAGRKRAHNNSSPQKMESGK